MAKIVCFLFTVWMQKIKGDLSPVVFDIREFKPDVYGKRQTVNITSVFPFFSC